MDETARAVLITDVRARASSLAEQNSAVRRLLPQLYREVAENPEEIPESPYDLWAVSPFECRPALPWEALHEVAEARVCIDTTDAHPAFDVVLTTVRTDQENPSLDRLLQLWGIEWHGEWVHPRWHWGWEKVVLPYVHPCSDGLAIPDGAPFGHVLWNVEHWVDNPEQHAWALKALPVLADCGVKIIYLTRCERGGVPDLDALDELGMSAGVLNAPEERKGLPDEKYGYLFDRACALIVSTPSMGMISVEKALARGIPVVGAPTNRWSEWFTTAEGLRAYLADTALYGQAREQMRPYFSDDAAVGQFRLAREIARAVRS